MEKIINHVLKFYALYIFIFGVIILNFYRYSTSEYSEKHPVDRFLGESVCQDRVVLVEERYDSFLARMGRKSSALLGKARSTRIHPRIQRDFGKFFARGPDSVAGRFRMRRPGHHARRRGHRAIVDWPVTYSWTATVRFLQMSALKRGEVRLPWQKDLNMD